MNSNDCESAKLLFCENKNLEIFADNIFGGVVLCEYNKDFTILYANKGFLDIAGYSLEEVSSLLQNKYTSCMIEREIAEVHAQIANQLKSQKSYSVTYRIKRKDGNIIWVLDKGVLIESPAGAHTIQCTLTDITQQKKIEDDLKISEKQYEIAMSYSDVTTYQYDVKTKELILIKRDAEFYGVETIVPNGPETFVRAGIIQPEYINSFLSMYQKIDAGEKTASCIVNSKSANGEIHDYELSLVNIFDDLGNPVRAIGVRKNVTHVRQLEREKAYSNVMASDQIFTYEANVSQNRIIKYNEEWAKTVGVSSITVLDDLTNFMRENIIFSQDAAFLAETLSRTALINAFERGEKLITVEYRKKSGADQYRWYRKNIHIIKDAISGNISIRCYVADIHDLKIRELKALEEHKLYETMIAKATTVYAVNVTQNQFISGHEKWGVFFGIEQSDCYSEMIANFAQKALHPEDLAGFNQCFLRQNILDAFFNGKNEIIHEYRRPNEKGEYIWVRCNFHLFEDVKTNDLIGYSYMEDIDEEKKRELDLIYKAEHDALTGLYNKDSVEKHITEFLSTAEGKSGKHAFFIMDLDNFKGINDTFGHLFGDAVISQTASKIRDLFRDIDILGRIGGDEYIALMKNISSDKIVHIKAQELIEKITDNFAQNDISISIGIALFQEHGKTYEQLYKKSDAALYTSKNNGRNQYTVYEPKIETGESAVKAINEDEFIAPKMFEDNIAEYVFRLLYESTDKTAAINTVLELVGKHYNVSRAYVLEKNLVTGCMKNTFEWCNKGVLPQIQNLQNLVDEYKIEYDSNFSDNGIYFVPDVSKLMQPDRGFLEAQQIKSMLQFSIMKDGEFRGFIGFDECRIVRPLYKKEAILLQNVASILGVFILGMRSTQETDMEKQINLSIINGLDSYVYVCDPNTYKLVFANEKTLAALPDAKIGSHCYESIRGEQAPCDMCPMKVMKEKNIDQYTTLINNSNLGKLIRVSGCWVNWTENRTMCLMNGIDVNEVIRMSEKQ